MTKNRGIAFVQFLTVIIAAIGLILLIGFGAKLFDAISGGEEKNAQKTIDLIKKKIDNLEEGETGESTIRGLEDWLLTAWGKEEPSPDKCLFESCICICKGLATSENCQKNGICRTLNVKEIKMKLTINNEDVDAINNIINLKENLIRLNIEKTSDSVIIKKILG